MGHDAVAEERIHAVAGAIEKLVGNHELQRLVLFLQRSHGGDGNDPFHAQLLEAINIGAEIQFAGKNAVPASVTRQERHFAALQRAQDIGVGRLAERRLQAHFSYFR